MAYVSREIKDRVAIGDNCFYVEELEDGRIIKYTHKNGHIQKVKSAYVP